MINTVFICGPTASGKTEYSVRLAEDIGGEIVSADSMQIYKYMDIGSAKPSEEELHRVRHYLIGEIDPRDEFSVFDYQQRALVYIKNISSNNKIPIVCGGTGLYINSLVYDMDFDAAQGSAEYRNSILERFGNDQELLFQYLKTLDPDAAKEIHPNNVKRVLRAVERIEKGEAHLKRFADAKKPSTQIKPILTGLCRDRTELYQRIDERVEKLFEKGLAQEVSLLLDMGLSSDDISMKGIGYKEVIDVINAGLPASASIPHIKQNTRHYAKRQLTWLKQYKDMQWFELKGSNFNEEVYQQLKDYVEKCIKNSQQNR